MEEDEEDEAGGLDDDGPEGSRLETGGEASLFCWFWLF